MKMAGVLPPICFPEGQNPSKIGSDAKGKNLLLQK